MEEMAAKLSSGQNVLNPNFSKKTAFDDDFISAPRTRKVQDLFTASSKLPSLSPHPLTSASRGKTEGRCLFFYFKIKKSLLSFELSHPAVPAASELIRQQQRPLATKYVLKRPMNI